MDLARSAGAMRPHIPFWCSAFAIANVCWAHTANGGRSSATPVGRAHRARPSILPARGSSPPKARNSRVASRVPELLSSFDRSNPSYDLWSRSHGRGYGVGRGLGVGVALGVAVGVAVGVALGVGVTVGVGLGVTLGVGVGVAPQVPPNCRS